MLDPLRLYRVARVLRQAGAPRAAALVQRVNYFLTGCDLPATVRIGKRVEFKHYGAGVIVNGAVDIGDDVMIMPHVVIGQNVRRGQDVVELERIVIGKGVLLGAGAKIIASGRLEIGDHAAVGANAVVTRDVEPETVVVGIPARPLESQAAKRRTSAGM